MKNGRIWIVILLILVVGMLSTRITRQYVANKESTLIAEDTASKTTLADSEEPSEESPLAMAAVIPETAVAGADKEDSLERLSETELVAGSPLVPLPEDGGQSPIMMAAPVGETGLPEQLLTDDSGETVEETKMAETKTVTTIQRSTSVPNTVIVENKGAGKGNSYLARLEELDAQIAKNKSTDLESAANYSVKAKAENSRKLWETELDGILEALKNRLDASEQESLMSAQREWLKEREQKAIDASKKQSGSSLEEVEYTVSLSESTRERAYALVKAYEAVLSN